MLNKNNLWVEYSEDSKYNLEQAERILSTKMRFSTKESFLKLLWNLSEKGRKELFERFVKGLESEELSNISYMLFGALREEKDELERKIGAYPYIPFSETSFVKIIKEIMVKRFTDQSKVRFIDVGCGYGIKPFIVHCLFPDVDVTGIEYNEQTFREAQRLSEIFRSPDLGYSKDTPKKKIHIRKENALEFDFGPYNFIYLYCPMAMPNSMHQLYNRIFETMPRGGIVLEVYKREGFENFLGEHGKRKCDHGLYDLFSKTITDRVKMVKCNFYDF